MNFAPPTRHEDIARSGGNVFAEFVNRHAPDQPRPRRAEAESAGGQITGCLSNVVGKFRPMG